MSNKSVYVQERWYTRWRGKKEEEAIRKYKKQPTKSTN